MEDHRKNISSQITLEEVHICNPIDAPATCLADKMNLSLCLTLLRMIHLKTNVQGQCYFVYPDEESCVFAGHPVGLSN